MIEVLDTIRNIEVRSYQWGDELLVEPVEEMSRLMRDNPDYREMWNKNVNPNRTWTGFCDGMCIALGGVSDRGFVWMILNRKTIDRKIAILRIVRQGFEIALDYCRDIPSIWTLVKKDTNKTEGIFARHFGFKLAGEIEVSGIKFLRYEWPKKYLS